MMFIAGVFYDDENAPTVLRDIAEVLPLTHLVDGLSGAMVEGEGLADHGPALLVLALWAAAGLVLAVRGFSWEARPGPSPGPRRAPRSRRRRSAPARAWRGRSRPGRSCPESRIARWPGLRIQAPTTEDGRPERPQP